jgi:signal transduction histidine kinase
VDLLACVLAATLAVYVFASIFFAVAFVRRTVDREYAVLAILSVALAESSLGSLLGSHLGADHATVVDDRVAWTGLIAAFALLVHFGLAYRGVARQALYLTPVYVIAAALEAANSFGLLHDPTRAAERHIVVRGVDVVYRGSAPSDLGVAACALGCLAVVAALTLAAQTYLAGRRDALAVVVGATALLATSINDLGVASQLFATTYLVPAGFVVFVIGASTTYSARYATGQRELARRTKELRTRTRELRKSYEELRAAQEELVKKEQLAVVGELAAVIAHEVRNPLAIIGNAVSGLRKATITRDDHETLLSILEEETTRLNRLVSDLLRYARPVNLQRQQINVQDLIQRALGLAKQKKNINLEVKDAVHDARLWGDGNLLRQVFDNLIDNAVQAMGSAGILTVRMNTATDEGKDGIAVEIVDTGEGMDTQVRSRAKDPFFTTRPSGTGLGLAIVDRIVDAHGGRFVIDSRSGEGTTVTVFLPYGSSSEPPPRPRMSSKGERAGTPQPSVPSVPALSAAAQAAPGDPETR